MTTIEHRLNRHSGPLLAERGGVRVVACRACGFAHVVPLPDAAALADYYAAEFWATKGAGWLARYEAQRDWLAMRDGDILELLGQYTLGRTLLDIGAGWGFFVKQAQEWGWSATGVDPSREASDYAQQRLNVYVEAIGWDDKAYPLVFQDGCAVKYDAITAFWLLEHLSEPRRFLEFCRAHLFTGGTLVVTVPNEWNYFQSFANESGECLPYFWVHPSHINYWNPATLGNLLGRCGFRVIDWLASDPIEFELIQGFDYTRDETVGDKVHAHIRQQELSMTRDERLARYRMLARQSVGRDLTVLAVPEG